MFNILHKNKQANSSSKYNNNSDYDILPTNLSTTENPFYNANNNATNDNNNDNYNATNNNYNATSNDKLNQFDPSLSMKNELKNFFKKKMDNNADVKGGLELPKGGLALPKDLLTLDNSPNYSAYS